MSTPILTTADLIFPSTSGNFSQTLTSLKRSRLSLKNRLASILHDTAFVTSIATTYALPLVANERCGSWYIPPARKSGSVYFKSTDGHASQWRFSTRRLNLQLLDILREHGGCIVVDSTRRGKIMPDALAKTMPIWCAVMNRVLFPERVEWHRLVVSGTVVSESEASQIDQRLSGFVDDLKELGLDWGELRAKVRGPLRPYFVAPEMDLPGEIVRDECLPVVCCSASRREKGDNDEYIQGAGDDNEHWSQGLTSGMFWQARDRFTPELTEGQLEDIIRELVSTQSPDTAQQSVHSVYQVGSSMRQVSLCSTDTLNNLDPTDAHAPGNERQYDLVITCDKGPNAAPLKKLASQTVHLDCWTSKNGSRLLRNELPKIDSALDFITNKEQYHVIVSCENGRDLSVGLALAVACRLEHGLDMKKRIDKAFIRQRLAALTARYSDANPSRATLQSVNAYLMQERAPG